MKEKQFGLIAVGAVAVSVLLTGGYTAMMASESDMLDVFSPSLIALKRQMRTPVPEADHEAKNAILAVQSQLRRLRIAGETKNRPVNHEMLGFTIKPQTQDTAAGAAAPAPVTEDFSSMVVSMTYVSGGDRFTVINDRLYQQGAFLPGQSVRVQTIDQDRILLVGEKTRQWVAVAKPDDIPDKPREPSSRQRVREAKEATAAAPSPSAQAAPSIGQAIGESVNMLKDYEGMLKSAGQGQY